MFGDPYEPSFATIFSGNGDNTSCNMRFVSFNYESADFCSTCVLTVFKDRTIDHMFRGGFLSVTSYTRAPPCGC